MRQKDCLCYWPLGKFLETQISKSGLAILEVSSQKRIRGGQKMYLLSAKVDVKLTDWSVCKGVRVCSILCFGLHSAHLHIEKRNGDGTCQLSSSQ